MTEQQHGTDHGRYSFWRALCADSGPVELARGLDPHLAAVRYGWRARALHGNRPFEAVAPILERDWDPSTHGLSWGEARQAIRDAYRRAPVPSTMDGEAE